MTDKSCQEILPILPLWLDGELDDESISVARDHVRDCRGCSHELQRLRRLKGAVLRASQREGHCIGGDACMGGFDATWSGIGERHGIDDALACEQCSPRH